MPDDDDATEAIIRTLFDGSHRKGTLVHLLTGGFREHQIINMYIVATDMEADQTTPLECQMTPDQAEEMIRQLTFALRDIAGR